MPGQTALLIPVIVLVGVLCLITYDSPECQRLRLGASDYGMNLQATQEYGFEAEIVIGVYNIGFDV